MLIFSRSFSKHLRWLIFCSLITAFAIIWYVTESVRLASWPGGSSFPGLTFGIIAAVLIVFEFLLWPRKKLRAWRIGKAQLWMRAHIWLGLLSLPLVMMHTGFRFGGQFNTILACIFYLVIGSGIFGLVMQNIIPRIMLDALPAETIYAQIDNVSQQHARDAQRKVDVLCARAGDQTPAASDGDADETSGPIVIGAVRRTGALRGKVLTTSTVHAPISNPETLRKAFDETILPFLLEGSRSGRLVDRRNRDLWFQDLKDSVDPAAHETLADLKDLCEQRRQFEVQKKLHWLLHGWLAIHVGLSLVLVLMLVVHIVMATRYW